MASAPPPAVSMTIWAYKRVLTATLRGLLPHPCKCSALFLLWFTETASARAETHHANKTPKSKVLKSNLILSNMTFFLRILLFKKEIQSRFSTHHQQNKYKPWRKFLKANMQIAIHQFIHLLN